MMNDFCTQPLKVLGIESSCDDTAAAVVRLDGDVAVLSSVVAGQDADHAPYGGVVPEIAARAHAVKLDQVAAQAMAEAKTSYADLDLIAVTAGPGLIGGVMSGLTFAKGAALAAGLPLVPVNHLAGHALSVGLEADVKMPYLLLLVSGGHTQLLLVEGPQKFSRLGTTIDDAAGEAFDKTAKLMGLSGAGGPAIEALAAKPEASAGRFSLPRPLLGRPGCDFSFSGLKTAMRETIASCQDRSQKDDADLAASFQRAAVAHLVDRTARAVRQVKEQGHAVTSLVAAGGVAANSALRAALLGIAGEAGWALVVPSIQYCTDNAAMIAYAGALAYRDSNGMIAEGAMEFTPRARWPLDINNQAGAQGTGRKGRKV